MRVIILGGTWFVGRAITQALCADGHAVLVVHRGFTEPTDLPSVRHLHAERQYWPSHQSELADFAPDAAVDVSAGNGDGARAALSALPPGIRLVALSSCDVYRAYESVRAGTSTDAVPLTEQSPLRTTRNLDGPQWENLEIEEAYLAAHATILRLGAVYGEHDYQRRLEPVLRRIRAGRSRLPIGSGGFLFSRIHANDVARAVLATLATPASARECLNIAETQTAPIRLFYQQIIKAARADLQLCLVPDRALPPDLKETGALSQHLLLSPAKARRVLGWHDTAGLHELQKTVRWHLDHPPVAPDNDFTADDAAIAS